MRSSAEHRERVGRACAWWPVDADGAEDNHANAAQIAHPGAVVALRALNNCTRLAPGCTCSCSPRPQALPFRRSLLFRRQTFKHDRLSMAVASFRFRFRFRFRARLCSRRQLPIGCDPTWQSRQLLLEADSLRGHRCLRCHGGALDGPIRQPCRRTPPRAAEAGSKNLYTLLPNPVDNAITTKTAPLA